jgi:hypothetical protein
MSRWIAAAGAELVTATESPDITASATRSASISAASLG